MSYILRTMLNPAHREALFDRLKRLDPTKAPLWGRMTAPGTVTSTTSAPVRRLEVLPEI